MGLEVVSKGGLRGGGLKVVSKGGGGRGGGCG